MFRVWQKGGIYYARLIGTNDIVIQTDDWRDFSAQFKLRLNHETTVSEVYAVAVKDRRKSAT